MSKQPQQQRGLNPVVPGEEQSANPEGADGANRPAHDPGEIQSKLDTLAAEQQALDEARAALAAEREQFERDKLAMQRSGTNEQSSLRPSPALVNASKQAQSAKANAADWSQRTSAEAAAAGVTKPVLCKDGHYVPSEFGSKA